MLGAGEEERGKFLIIDKGQRCPKRGCPCRLHDICTQNFFRTQKAKKCPLCKTDWTGNDFVGERAVTGSEGSTNGKRRSGVGSTARGNVPAEVEEPEDAEENEQPEEPEEIEEDADEDEDEES